MNIYRYILGFLLILFLIEDYIRKNEKLYKSLKVLVMVVLVLMIGFRGTIGRDTRMYIDYFENLVPTYEYFKNTRFEFLYFVLNALVKFFTNNYTILFLIIAGITFINLHIIINYFSISYFYSIAFYYCRWVFQKEFSGIRNALACSFFYLALIELYKNNFKKYYFLTLASGLIHKSMFFYLCLPIFYKFMSEKIKIKEKIIYISIILIPLIMVLINFKKTLNILLMQIGIHPAYLIGAYSEKATDIVYYYSIFFLIVLMFFDKKLINKFESKYIYLKKIYLFSCLVGASLFQYGDLAGRLVAWSNVEFLLQDKLLYLFKKRFFIRIILCFLLILLYYLNFTLKLGLEAEYLPYFR